jgi:hypothetical protein
VGFLLNEAFAVWLSDSTRQPNLRDSGAGSSEMMRQPARDDSGAGSFDSILKPNAFDRGAGSELSDARDV